MGDPKGLDNLSDDPPAFQTLVDDTMIAYRDMDGSPAKAWMIHHREEEDVEPLYQLAFGKRPREELYDLTRDPDYITNVAAVPEYEPVRSRMEERLRCVLEEQNDPRLMEQPCRYEYEPYAGPVDRAWFDGAATLEAMGPGPKEK